MFGITDNIIGKGSHRIEWFFHIPHRHNIIQENQIIIKIINKEYKLKYNNLFDKISLIDSVYWPDYGVEKKGQIAYFEIEHDLSDGNSYNFKIG